MDREKKRRTCVDRGADTWMEREMDKWVEERNVHILFRIVLVCSPDHTNFISFSTTWANIHVVWYFSSIYVSKYPQNCYSFGIDRI
jgi:hypothetical protein